MNVKEKIRALEDFAKSDFGSELKQTQLAHQKDAVEAILANRLNTLDDLVSLISQVGQLKQTQVDLFAATIDRLRLEIPNE